jgi:hypothetical protein
VPLNSKVVQTAMLSSQFTTPLPDYLMQISSAIKTENRTSVVHLRDRDTLMLKKELLLRNPLRTLGKGNEIMLLEGTFGAVLANAGVGKTALLVQLALSAMLQGRNVLHISLDHSINKVRLWYEELFQDISKEYPSPDIDQIFEDTLPHRFIMTFKVEGFSAPKLDERLMDLTVQNIFHPHMVIIDGFFFGPSARESLLELKRLADKYHICVWLTVLTHRHETPTPEGMPPDFSPVSDLFDLIFQLEPKGTDIRIQQLKGISSNAPPHRIRLDPSTMLIYDELTGR